MSLDQAGHDLNYQSEIELAVNNLNAERSDIEQLILPLAAKGVSRQQISGVLRLSWERLQELRNAVTNFSESICSGSSDFTDLLQRCESALQPGLSFSLEAGTQALDSLHRAGVAEITEPRSMSSILEMQALGAAAGQEYERAAELYGQAAQTEHMDAERQWKFLMAAASMLLDYGREFGSNESLHKAIDLLENKIPDLVSREARPADWASSRLMLGNVFGVLGQRQGGTRNLDNAISAFQESLDARDRQRQPLQWAETQNSLGNALGILGHRLGDEEMMVQSITAFEQALEERTRWRVPLEWAITQNNLAAVLQSQGQKNKDTKMLKRSVEAYKDLLDEWTKERVPLEWAATMNNMGTALRLLGEHRKGPRTLEQSVAAYNSSLSIRSRDQFPQEWAMVQNNLGAALQKLAEREENPDILSRAVDAYENALLEWTRDQVPMTWAMTLANLGVARRTLAEVTEDIESARKAVKELETVSDVFRHASHAQYSELSIDQLAQARKLVDTLDRA
jgi:tetratricopeptide (TPR) repeat protein